MSSNNVVMQMATQLEQAKQSLASAQAQVTVLTERVAKYEKVLAAVTDILGPDDVPMPTAKRGAPTKRPHKNKELKTDSAFWLSLITAAPQTASEITVAAANKLGIRLDDADQIAVIKKRRPMALEALIEAKKIKSEGDRNTRTFSL